MGPISKRLLVAGERAERECQVLFDNAGRSDSTRSRKSSSLTRRHWRSCWC